MNIYVSGVDNFRFRQLMFEAGVLGVSINYNYACRTPNVNWQKALSSFDRVMAEPGVYGFELEYRIKDYAEFLNQNKNLLDFAIAPLGKELELKDMTQGIEIVPIFDVCKKESMRKANAISFSKESLEQPFVWNHLRSHNVFLKHGYNIPANHKYFNEFNSLNTGEWLLGKYGYVFVFDGRNIKSYNPKKRDMRQYAIGVLKTYGIEVDMRSIMQGDKYELYLMNLHMWRLLQEYHAGRRIR